MNIKEKWDNYKKNFSKKDIVVLAIIPTIAIPVYLVIKYYKNKTK